MNRQEDYVWEDIWRNDDYRSPMERERRALRRLSALGSVLGEDLDLGDVVEVGCGDGSLANAMFASPLWALRTYRGFDRSTTAINRAKQKCSSISRAQFDVADITQLSQFTAAADTVIACGLIEHIRNEQDAFTVLRSLCRPSSRLLLTTSNSASLMFVDRLIRQALGKWQYGYQKNYSAKSLTAAMSTNFRVRSVQVQQGDWDLPGSAVVDRTASLLISRAGRYLVVLAVPQSLPDGALSAQLND